MTQELTCFLASIGPSHTPITILSLASSAAACSVWQGKKKRIFLYLLPEHGHRGKLFLVLL
jgi:hypothetical protein